METTASSAAIRDDELVARVRRGDAGALAALHARHRKRAEFVAFRVLQNHALADDAVQEAFIDLWRGAGRYDPARASVSSWVAVLAHRRAVDIARREARRRLDASPNPPPDDSYTTEEVVVLREEQRRVQRALAELPPPQRTLLELAYYGGMTQSQLADRFDLPLGTVKSRMFEALRVLRRELQPA